MPRAVTRQKDNWKFVLPEDRSLPENEQTVFTLRPLNGTERARVVDSMRSVRMTPDGSRETVVKTSQQGVAIALSHIVAIENFPPGAPQPWPDELEARRAYLEQFEDRDIDAIGDEIWSRSQSVKQPTVELQEV